jgi:hypothetical protein
MKGGTQAALALGVGYLLGRRRQMRLTTMLAAGAATGSVGGLGGAALKRGMKMLGSTEAVAEGVGQLLSDYLAGQAVGIPRGQHGAALDSHQAPLVRPAGDGSPGLPGS